MSWRCISLVATVIILVVVLHGDGTPAVAETPTRIVSINLCADQYLLALAEPRQILALSPFAADPAISFHADRAKRFARVRDDAESVLLLKPDLVIASVYNRAATLDLLREHGMHVLTIPHPARLDQVAQQITRIAEAIGRRAAGEKLRQRYEQALRRSRNAAPAGLTALYYDRGGYVLGSQTLIAELMAHVGLKNAASRLGITTAGSASVEAVLAVRPDILVVPRLATKSDLGSMLLAHPALRRLYPRKKRAVLPSRLTVCPGPSMISALDTLVMEIRRMVAAWR